MGHAYLQNKIASELGLDFSLDLPDAIPLSLIASSFRNHCAADTSDADLKASCFEALQAIFGKYVQSTASLEVNISSAVRHALYQTLNSAEAAPNQRTETDLDNALRSMEHAVLEISQLMNDSFHRFRSKTIFTELTTLVNDE